MHDSPRPLHARNVGSAAWSAVGLTHPAVIDAYVERRVQDPSLLSTRRDPSYADFFVPAV